LNLADLVENLPLGSSLSRIAGINNHGDMLGSDQNGGNFLLERVGATGPQSFAAPDGVRQSAAEARHGVPPAVAAARLRQLPPLKSGSILP
jgi:hypothetical protein